MLENRACEIFIEKRYKNAKLIFEKSILSKFLKIPSSKRLKQKKKKK